MNLLVCNATLSQTLCIKPPSTSLQQKENSFSPIICKIFIEIDYKLAHTTLDHTPL